MGSARCRYHNDTGGKPAPYARSKLAAHLVAGCNLLHLPDYRFDCDKAGARIEMAAKLYTDLFHNELALFAGRGARSTGRGVESSARLRGAGGFFPIFLGRLL